MNQLLQCVFLVLFCVSSCVQGYCWEPGWNPDFKAAPKVEQITISKVRISWVDIVTKRECADQFLVKYWQKNTPQGYKLTSPVSTDVNHIDVEVVPKVPYNFQAVAREDKGPVRGVDWNKSPIVEFKTSNFNVEVKDAPPDPELDLVTRPFVVEPSTRSPLEERGETGIVFAGITVEVLAIIVIGGFVVLLILIGLVYKCFRGKSAEMDDDDEEPTKDDLEAGETDDLKSNTDAL